MRLIALMIAVLAALANASAANAHASLIGSEPADRMVLEQPPAAFTLTFNEPVSPLALRLARPGGEVVRLERFAINGPAVVVTLPPDLSRGSHLLSWRVISADGHPVGGALTFSIGQPSAVVAPGQTADDPRLRGAIWLARVVVYLGLLVGVGGVFYGHWIAAAPPAGRLKTFLVVTLESGLAAALVSVGLHGVDVLGVSPSDIRQVRTWHSGLTTAYGLTLCLAVTSLMLGLMAISGRGGRWCSALALAGVGAAVAASGHASTAGPEWATRSAVFVHGVSVSIWVGALLPLSTALRTGGDQSELMRFSRAIPWPVAALIVTGLFLAMVQVQQVNALRSTSYGLILSGKLVAVCALLALAALNRRLTPRVASGDGRAAQRLVRSIQTEMAIVVVILGLVACWRFTPPPRAVLAAAAQPLHVHVHTEKAMADLQFAPATADGRRVTAILLDGEFRPLSAKEVVLVLSKSDAGIEPLRLTARLEAATWRIDGVRLPISGRWQVRVEVLVSDFEKVTLEDEIELR